MPFKLFEFLEQIMIGAFLITLTQLKKTGSIGKVFIPLEIQKINFTFENTTRSRFFASFPRSYLVSATYIILSRSKSFELKKAYILKCIYKCINMYECISVLIRGF